MAYLIRKEIGPGTYYYIIQSYRRGGKVKKKILEYLGRDPDPERLKCALEYWRVKAKPGKGRR